MYSNRRQVLATLVAIGGVSIAVGTAQGPPPAAIAAMQVERVKSNLYIVTAAAPDAPFNGGNTAVFVTGNGITLVDTKVAGFGRALLDRIRTISDKPIVRIISTHTHGDHTGNYPVLGAPMVETIVHENARADMVKRSEFSGDRAQYAPNRTFKERLAIGTGTDRIDLYYFGRGHTNGDAFVVFAGLKAMHVGDMFAWKALPYIDREAGGSVVEHAQSLARAVATVKDVDTIINGHMPVSTWSDLKEYADFASDFVAYARRAKTAGKPAEDAAASYAIPARFRGYVPTLPDTPTVADTLRLAYDEL